MAGSPSQSTLGTGTTFTAEGHFCPSISEISENKDRINALYSPFRPKHANPESFQQKIKFWSKVVDEYVDFGNRLTFTLKEIQKGTMVDNRVSACIPQVLEHLCRDGVILSENGFNDFLKSSTSWLGWSQISMKKAVTKAVALVPLPSWSFFSNNSDEIRFIHVNHLKKQVVLLTNEPTIQGNLVSLSDFKSAIKRVLKVEAALDVEIVLRYLKGNNLITTDNVGHEEVVLMKVPGIEPKITVVEKGKYDVFRTKEMLEKQLEDLHQKASIAEENTKKALKQGKRNTAKHELKRKKLLEQRADKLLTMVDNLTVIALKIEDAESDATMLLAYEAGKKALAGVLEDKKLTVDRVTEAMLDIQDLLDTQSDISAAMAQSMDGQDDALELDEELEMLLKEDEEMEKEKLAKLRNKEADEALKQLEGLSFGDDLNESGPSPTNKELHSSITSDT